MARTEFDRQLAISRLTRKDICDKLEMSEMTLSRKISGQRAWKINEMFALVDIFEISLEEAKEIFLY